MRPIARQRWDEVLDYLVGLEAITAGELPLVERYCCVYCRWREAEAVLAAGEIHYRTIENRAGDPASAVASAAMAQASKAFDQLQKLEQRLGLAPVERCRLPIAVDAGEEDEVDVLFRKAGFG